MVDCAMWFKVLENGSKSFNLFWSQHEKVETRNRLSPGEIDLVKSRLSNPPDPDYRNRVSSLHEREMGL